MRLSHQNDYSNLDIYVLLTTFRWIYLCMFFRDLAHLQCNVRTLKIEKILSKIKQLSRLVGLLSMKYTEYGYYISVRQSEEIYRIRLLYSCEAIRRNIQNTAIIFL